MFIQTAHAATGIAGSTLTDLIIYAVKVINLAMYVLIAASVVIFIYGIIKYVLVDISTPQKRTEARWYMGLGIIAFTIVSGLWAIVNAFVSLFGLEPDVPFFDPSLNEFRAELNVK